VVNNSHKVVVVNRHTLEKTNTLEGSGINNPRYFIAEGNTGYISNWGDATNPEDDFISVVDLNTHSITHTIPVGEGPEQMIINGGKLYVALKGGWGFGNQISVIDTSTQEVEQQIDLGYYVPGSMALSADGSLYVLCSGKPAWADAETPGALVKITNGAVSYTHAFGQNEHPDFLGLYQDNLYYYLNGTVYYAAATEPIGTPVAITGLQGYYYYMTIHNGKIYTLDALDYLSEGILQVYDTGNNSIEATYNTGIIPGYIAFNE